ncbi:MULTISPECIES: helix-turn-helix domain-containing protein [Kitasatospora]|uniref:helix-turn-helix domain-containing protein n=1 Tax=Kitasatospora TaxID=2063 RepID=UPI000C704377|nr:XRE family transcriptional regulator [Kitasatospora sp. GP30]MDH6138228.1 Zn-dependent peptidase ImmA (M78 family)/transcriptional regulator with XRE-family HTH domain [Kitasatospora sp. GP30]
MKTAESWNEIGERVAEARQAAGVNQGELAMRLGLDRTALVRIESGERKISAMELFQIAEALGVPAAHFVMRPPTPLVSRRHGLDEDADDATRTRFRFDALLEAHARDAQWLIEQGFLVPPTSLVRPEGPVDPASLAQTARAAIGKSRGPLGGLARIAEQYGLYLLSVDAEGEGASLLLDGFGVAVVGGQAAPGRRRWTGAHELGHHLLQDEYHSDLSVAAGRDEREELIDRIADEFLMPDADLQEAWRQRAQDTEPRSFFIEIAARYRVSWGVVVRKAIRLGLVSGLEARQLRASTPTRGDLLAVYGGEPTEDLTVGTTGPQWRKAVLDAWGNGAVTGPRAVELLHGAIGIDELPLRALEEPAP